MSLTLHNVGDTKYHGRAGIPLVLLDLFARDLRFRAVPLDANGRCVGPWSQQTPPKGAAGILGRFEYPPHRGEENRSPGKVGACYLLRYTAVGSHRVPK